MSRVALTMFILAALVWALVLSSCHTAEHGYVVVPYFEIADVSGDFDATEYRGGVLMQPRSKEGAAFDHSFRDFKLAVDASIHAALEAQAEADAAADHAAETALLVAEEDDITFDTPWGPITVTGGAAGLGAWWYFFGRKKKDE